MLADLSNYRDLGLPPGIIAEYFGVWAIEPTYIQSTVNNYQGCNLHAHVDQAAIEQIKQQASTEFAADDDIALIEIRGRMQKHASSFSNASSTIAARRQIRSAVGDTNVSGILITMDTPGGTAAGTSDLADEIARAAARKPVFGFVEDLTASAGVHAISHSTKVYANQSDALYGSIGTYAYLQDLSGMAAQMGVKVHVIRAGQFKGAGAPGTEITAEQLEEIQRLVDAINERFLDSVAKGRDLPLARVRELADGRVHPADQAAGLGLIDGVKSFDEVAAELRAAAAPRRGASQSRATSGALPCGDAPHRDAAWTWSTFESSASSTTNRQKGTIMEPATINELKAACPGAPSDFIVAQLEAGASVQDAQTAFIAQRNSELEQAEQQAAQREEAARAEAEEAAAARQTVGAQPLAGGDGNLSDGSAADPVARFHEQVETMMREDNLSASQATLRVARNDSKLHQDYIRASQPKPSARLSRLLEEKFDAASDE